MNKFRKALIKTLRQRANISVILSKEHFTEWDTKQDFLVLQNAEYQRSSYTLARPNFIKLDIDNRLDTSHKTKTFKIFEQLARALRKCEYMKVQNNKLTLYDDDVVNLWFAFDLNKIKGVVI